MERRGTGEKTVRACNGRHEKGACGCVSVSAGSACGGGTEKKQKRGREKESRVRVRGAKVGRLMLGLMLITKTATPSLGQEQLLELSGLRLLHTNAHPSRSASFEIGS